MRIKISEFAFVQRFWSQFEKSSVNHDMLQLSKFTSFTIFLDLVNRYISLSKCFVVHDPSVYVYVYIYIYSPQKLTSAFGIAEVNAVLIAF